MKRTPFKDKYTTQSRAEQGRTQITEESYAIGTMLEEILIELKRMNSKEW